ncbi:MAG TPA: oligopeptide/dipeptide ABC transporter ATP-binding protein [Thermomicrobiales bacterium]|nr:oligopeptide/dipeptide ABC transporter ATP-binding protein [Thermomicrobiales bacterium]
MMATTAPSEPILRVEGLVKHFPIAGSALTVKAVTDVSFSIGRGETLGLVGESGSGKTTVGRCILRLTDPTAGRIVFAGQDITALAGSPLRRLRPRIQMVFQDPHDSLDPRHRVADIVAEPLRLAGMGDARERAARVDELLEMVQLRGFGERFPHQLTGGQAQRVAIARAIATQPDLIVLDEPTSALDIAVRADIIHLLLRLQQEFGASYLFISHDLTAVRHIADRVAIMYLGQAMEVAPTAALFRNQLHPYGKALLSSVLYPDPAATPARFVLSGEIPSPIHVPPACPLHTRCPLAQPECATMPIRLTELAPAHESACTRAIGEGWTTVPEARSAALTPVGD